MKRLSILVIVFILLNMIGCSMPTVTTARPLYSFTKTERISKGGLMSKQKFISYNDFRGQEAYDEDIDGLKKDVEAYILKHPDLNEQTKDNLRALRVTQGATVAEVTLLLNQPDRVIKAASGAPYGATEIWVYRISKLRAFTIFIFPIFFVHEGYYLYFKDGMLQEIERHYLRQVIRQSEPITTGVIRK